MTRPRKTPRLPPSRVNELLEEALVDANGEGEEMMGLHALIEENLAVPFATRILGVDAEVERVMISDANELVAVCRRGKETLNVSLPELPLPTPPPDGWEWIEAYRAWARRRG